MGCQEKFCYIRTRDSRKYYYGVVLHILLYTWRDRSRIAGGGAREGAIGGGPDTVPGRLRTHVAASRQSVDIACSGEPEKSGDDHVMAAGRGARPVVRD